MRDAIVLGQAYQLNTDWRIYGEAAWAFYYDGGAEPWEIQFGVEYSPYSLQGPNGLRGFGPWANLYRGKVIGSPFIAANGHLREELDYSGTLSYKPVGNGAIRLMDDCSESARIILMARACSSSSLIASNNNMV